MFYHLVIGQSFWRLVQFCLEMFQLLLQIQDVDVT